MKKSGTDGRTNGRTNGWTNVRTDERTDGVILSLLELLIATINKCSGYSGVYQNITVDDNREVWSVKTPKKTYYMDGP